MASHVSEEAPWFVAIVYRGELAGGWKMTGAQTEDNLQKKYRTLLMFSLMLLT